MPAADVKGVPTQLGHVALRVRDVERSIAFYNETLGLEVKMRAGPLAFLGIRPDASHEIALFPAEQDALPPDPARAGLYHMAWEMASFDDLVALNERLKERGERIVGYSDRQCNVMFLDPDGNELEAIWEPSEQELAAMKERGEDLPRLAP